MPPDNTPFMIAAYTLAATIILGYALILYIRYRKYR